MTRVLKLEPQVTYRKQGYCIWTHVGPSVVSDLFFSLICCHNHPISSNDANIQVFVSHAVFRFKDYFVKTESRQLFWQLFALTSRSR